MLLKSFTHYHKKNYLWNIRIVAVRKFFCLLPIFLASFQLTFAHAMVAALGSGAAQAPVADHGQQTVSEKHHSLFNLLLQLLNPEEEVEEEDSQLWAHQPLWLQNFYSFIPVFSVKNKHFLIHYAASIKGKLPALFLLHNIFRL
jgi:hypothetical protein